MDTWTHNGTRPENIAICRFFSSSSFLFFFSLFVAFCCVTQREIYTRVYNNARVIIYTYILFTHGSARIVDMHTHGLNHSENKRKKEKDNETQTNKGTIYIYIYIELKLNIQPSVLQETVTSPFKKDESVCRNTTLHGNKWTAKWSSMVKSTSNDMAVIVYCTSTRRVRVFDTGRASIRSKVACWWTRARAAYRCGNSVTNQQNLKYTETKEWHKKETTQRQLNKPKERTRRKKKWKKNRGTRVEQTNEGIKIKLRHWDDGVIEEDDRSSIGAERSPGRSDGYIAMDTPVRTKERNQKFEGDKMTKAEPIETKSQKEEKGGKNKGTW